jgi:biotin-dependent carboxylase-like uncharacterized protein
VGQIKIISPGLLTTVQDLGRYGYQQYGVSVSGAMDHVAARLANIIAGNDEDDALLEITLIGPKIEFMDNEVIAITGGDLQPHINDMPVRMYQALEVKKGEILSFKGNKKGCRAYLAFAGGIDVPVVMGSRSTFLKAKIGGYEGRPLKAGDILSIGNPHIPASKMLGRKTDNFYTYDSGKIRLRVVLGPQDDAFTNRGIETLFSNEYTVTNKSDRMGYTLNGPLIEHKNGADIISDGIAMGAIQVPSNGNPIIMMADRQTTGGYTKIGNVISVDLPKVAQAKPGDIIVFERIGLKEAHKLYKQLEDKIQSLKEFLNNNIKRNIKHYNIKINSKTYKVKVEEIY